MRVILYISLIFFSFNSHAQVGAILINEFMASNSNIDLPGHSNNDDWIEIKNTTSSNIDISGYYITDNLSDLTKVKLPATPGSVIVPANGYLLLICSNEPFLGSNHIVLGLSASGESIGLTASDGTTLLDSFTFGPQKTDISMGRHPINIDQWKYFKKPTPAAANSTVDMFDELIPAPVFSHTAGFYTLGFDLSLSSDDPDATIYYTLDGSDPNPANLNGSTFSYKITPGDSFQTEVMNTYLYSTAISINNRTSQANKVSVKSSSPMGYVSYFPDQLVSKGTVVKAIASKPGGISEISVNTYFVFPTENRYTLPVVSISLDEKKMFDFETGFYTWGANYLSTSPCSKANYYEDWKYSGNIEYFVDQTRVIDREVGFKMHGGCSRVFPRKTLRILGGSNFDYPLFNSMPERNHRNFILRNGGQNSEKNFMKDAINHDVMAGLKFGKQEVSPTVVFINGEYWGIQDMRERIDKHYLNALYGVDKQSIDLVDVGGVASASEGDKLAYDAMMNFVGHNVFNNTANYDSLTNLIDIENFIDYFIAQTYIANTDWPNGNMRLWRKRTTHFDPKIEGPEDGRWRWIFFDTDMTTYNFVDRIEGILYDTHINSLIFRKLSSSSRFKNDFGLRYADLLNTLFLSSRTTAIVDDYILDLKDEIEEHAARWKSPTLSTWQLEINRQKDFFSTRPNYQRGFLMKFLGLNTQRNLTVNVSDSKKGYIKVNTIDILPSTPGVSENPYPWTGIYYQNLPLTLKAFSEKGGKFKHWLKDGTVHSTQSSITVNLTANETYTAVFDENILSDNPFPIAKILDECGFEFGEWSNRAAVGSHPLNMAFVYFNPVENRTEPDHVLADTLGGFTSGEFNHTNRTRVNGLGANGVSFINTGGPAEYDGYPYGRLGGLLLALNTLGQDSIYVDWTGGTVLPNKRDYAIRLQYRIGDIVGFRDVLDANDNPIEYERSAIEGHEAVFEKVKMPDEFSNQPYVQLLWNYYFKGSITSGARAQLRVDDIKVFTKSSYDRGVNQIALRSERGVIESSATINSGFATEYKASEYILLEPGFNTENDAVFKAEVNICEEVTSY